MKPHLHTKKDVYEFLLHALAKGFSPLIGKFRSEEKPYNYCAVGYLFTDEELDKAYEYATNLYQDRLNCEPYTDILFHLNLIPVSDTMPANEWQELLRMLVYANDRPKIDLRTYITSRLKEETN